MQGKEVHNARNIIEIVKKAIHEISDPVVATLGIDGGNVLFQNEAGLYSITNDGVTIAKNITSSDNLTDGVMNLLRQGSLRTNQEVGDGTTTTMLLARELSLLGLGLVEEGVPRRVVKEKMGAVAKNIIDDLETQKKTLKPDDYEKVATVSSGGDKEIARNVAEALIKAGRDGFLILDTSPSKESNVKHDAGFVLQSGMTENTLYSNKSNPLAMYENAHALISDDRIYYDTDAQHIIRKALEAKVETLVFFAKDFIGDAPNTFITNHSKKKLNVVLIKVEDDTARHDLSVYLNVEPINEKTKKRFSSVGVKDFVPLSSIKANPHQSVIQVSKINKKGVSELVDALQKELSEKGEDDVLKRRVASLTTGITTIRVGGNTDMEMREKLYRYEDALKAVRSAMIQGYVVGGGIALLNCHKRYDDEIDQQICDRITQAPLKQLLGDRYKTHRKELGGNMGFDLTKGEVVDMLKEGIIEPLLVGTQSVQNATSVAQLITSLENYVVYERESREVSGNSGKN